ncbi:DUF3151 domain-containing protein [Gordonia sp. w5E2]|uniref:DUF3151 domain-containing protein n=2 Tax=Gordonia TaxID=2053 RepID=A0ABR5I9S9_9ACTN|nr:DUF3151 domain-containing protein [Gordonia jacobaea]KNA90412.1 hypothetical protein ABW18_16120 [Gordonia jacobaea]
MTSFGDLMGPQPTLLPGDDEAESDLLNGASPAAVAAEHPTASIAWAYLAEAALTAGGVGADGEPAGEQTPNVDDVIAAYAYARTGYHRGLDQLRRNGWKGFGPVPWAHEGNQGFLRCVGALARAARVIGERDEYLRCLDLLNESDPTAAEQLGLV